MKSFELEIFEQTSDYSEARFGDGGPPKTRGLDRKAIDELVAAVEDAYGEGAVAPRVYGAGQLHTLGERLFAFLDGDQRWLTAALTDPAGATLRIDAGERLRHLPWELMAADGSFLSVAATAPLLPVRACRANSSVGAGAPQNRPLRVLFMATSPEGVEPELAFEAEEAAILAATAETGTELVVEESGTLDGLRFTAQSYGERYFDVLHLSGHATVRDGQPLFVVENELGAQAAAAPDDIARAMAGQWPRLVFVSGCLTGNAPGAGAFPSMSESLVRAGAPAVLGWALPVGDVSASDFAAHLYQALASGGPLDRAIISARQHLYAARSPYWHLLRTYADASPLAAIVTAKNAPLRAQLRIRHAAEAFLDPQTQISRVAPRDAFVGRRRVIQRCLRALKQPLEHAGAAEALVLQGMGGLGKSTLASRLLERMPTHQRAVWFGRVDLVKFRELVSKIAFPSLDQQIEATKLLDNDQADLAARLRFLLTGPLGQTPCLFVFDDFEKGNLDERDGSHVLSPDMAQILPALLTAIRDTNSPSRVIITSRYGFHAPPAGRVRIEALETLTGLEQTKKLASLVNLRPEATTPPDTKQRAIQAASGNPRLLEWLDRVVADPALDVDALIGAIENEADRFRREDIFAEKLLATQPVELQKMLAKLNVIELPVPAATVYAVHDDPHAADHVDRATQLGLLEAGTDPETSTPRYFVSNVLRPLIRPLITDDEYTHACAAAARSLYEIWVKSDSPASEPHPA